MSEDKKTEDKKPEDKAAEEQAEAVKAAAVPKIDETLDKVIDKINDADSILVTLSKDPSVDEMAAALGLTLMLDSYGKHTTAIYSGKTPNALEFLRPGDTFESNTNSLQDFIIALDKEKADHLRYKIEGDFVKVYITPYKTTITEKDLEFSRGEVNVDLVIALNVIEIEDLDAALSMHGRIMHNAGLINVSNEAPGRLGGVEWSNPLASSVSEMIVVLLETMKQEITKEIATALLTGIVAATERFSNNRTTPDTLALASKLMQLGADQQLIVAQMMSAKEDEGSEKGTSDGSDGADEEVANETPVVAETVAPVVTEAPVTEAPAVEVVAPEVPVISTVPEVAETVAPVVEPVTPELTPEQQLEQMIKGSTSGQSAQPSAIMEELKSASAEAEPATESVAKSVTENAAENVVETPSIVSEPVPTEEPVSTEGPAMVETTTVSEPTPTTEPKVEVNIQPDDKNLGVAAVPQSKVEPNSIYGTDVERTAIQDKTISPLEEKPKDYAALMAEALAEVPENNPAVIATPAVQPVPEVPAMSVTPNMAAIPTTPAMPVVAPTTPVESGAASVAPAMQGMPAMPVMQGEASAIPTAPVASQSQFSAMDMNMMNGGQAMQNPAVPQGPVLPQVQTTPEMTASQPMAQQPVQMVPEMVNQQPAQMTPEMIISQVQAQTQAAQQAAQAQAMPQMQAVPQAQAMPELPMPPAPDVSNMMPPTPAMPPMPPAPQAVSGSPEAQLINPAPMPVDESEAQLTLTAPTGVQVQTEPVNPVVVQPDQDPASVPPVSDPGAFKIPGM